ncbi:hypothetical protein [Streptomyces sp. NPDC016172]|uniref:hypothetical protein n=1 Tax=Streptomyces sp. NPDC016172 TaxID=3364964 RepID=UPI0036FD0B92
MTGQAGPGQRTADLTGRHFNLLLAVANLPEQGQGLRQVAGCLFAVACQVPHEAQIVEGVGLPVAYAIGEAERLTGRPRSDESAAVPALCAGLLVSA